MEIRNFITFKKIVETGSFTKASHALGYAQSTITSHIQQIEEYMGAPVFERLGHRLLLTDLGTALLEETEVLLDSFERIERLNQAKLSQAVTVRIGAEEAILLYKLKELFRDFKLLRPEVELVMINEPYQILGDMLANGTVDVIFIIDKLVDNKDFIVKTIDHEPMMFISSPDYEQKRKDNTIQLPRIILTRKGGTYSSIFENYLREKNIIHEIVMEAWSLELAKQSVILGMGTSFLPEITVRDEIANGQLFGETVNLTGKRRIYSQMIYHSKKKISPALETLFDLVTNEKSK